VSPLGLHPSRSSTGTRSISRELQSCQRHAWGMLERVFAITISGSLLPGRRDIAQPWKASAPCSIIEVPRDGSKILCHRLPRCKREIWYGGVTPVLAMRRTFSLIAASNGVMRRCLLRWQEERLFLTFCLLGHLCHGCASNERRLLANPLQSSRSPFSWGSFRSLFAVKEGMMDTPIAALGGWPTVSGGFLRLYPIQNDLHLGTVKKNTS
jgi:hypothetical protein